MDLINKLSLAKLNSTLNDTGNTETNSPDNNKGKRHRFRKRSKKKRSQFKKFTDSLKRNPLKIIAPFFLVLIIYLSTLFFLYDDGDMTLSEQLQVSNNSASVIKGLVVPIRILERKQILIDFGDRETADTAINPIAVSLDQLKNGYVINPLSFISCDNSDNSSAFTLYLNENRLYVNINFRLLFSNSIEGSIDKNKWAITPKNISGFYSDDNLLEILDDKLNVLFNMQFTDNDMLYVGGYFVGKKCICIAGGGLVTSQPNSSEFSEKTLAEVERIKKIHTYNNLKN